MNVAINGLTNCRLHNVAAYDAPGKLEFVASKVNSGGAKVMPRSRRFEFFYDHPEIIRVRCDRLDDELSGDFDFVLMDIEGAEYPGHGRHAAHPLDRQAVSSARLCPITWKTSTHAPSNISSHEYRSTVSGFAALPDLECIDLVGEVAAVQE
jgi:hypothetical protein